MKRLLCLILSLFMAMSCLVTVSVAGDGTEVVLVDQESVIGSYKDGLQDFVRPDAGMNTVLEMMPSPERTSIVSPSGHTFLMINLMQYSGQVREDGKDMPLDDNFFYSLRTTFENARKSGATVGIRFRFDWAGNTNKEPDWDNMIQMFLDIEANGILDDYADILIWCEMGTLGAFGEQWGTRYGDYGYSDELIDLYLRILPGNTPLLLRTSGRITHWVNAKLGDKLETPYGSGNIQNMVEEVKTTYKDVKNDTANYHSGDGKDFTSGNPLYEDLGRLGMYNDGYMGTKIDYGTYANRENETNFLYDQTDVVYGGEFSGDRKLQIYWTDYTTVWYPVNGIPEMYYTDLAYLHGGPWRENPGHKEAFGKEEDAKKFIEQYEHVCKTIGREELAGTATIEFDEPNNRYIVTYTALGFDTLPFTEEIEKAVEDKIGIQMDLSDYYGQSCFDFIRQHLGYRFVLRKSMMSGGTLDPGSTLSFDLAIENTGFHKLVREKKTELVLENNGKVISMPLDIDATDWIEGIHTFGADVELPGNITGGKWKVYLRIVPDAEKIYTAYGIPFANEGIYNSELGANLIGEITVSGEEASGEAYVSPLPAGRYYDGSIVYKADDTDMEMVRGGAYTFTEEGHWGYTILFKIDGIKEGSEISLPRWRAGGSSSSDFQLHCFNWFFKNQTYGYGAIFKENGYYLMYCPFFSVGAMQSASVVGSTKVTSLLINSPGTPREDKNTEPSLNGNDAIITPLGIMEGAPTGYDITFHYNEREYNYTGKYAFSGTTGATASNCQFKTGESIGSLYDGETPVDYTYYGIKYKFKGWTTREGYSQGLLSEDFVAVGEFDLYPYYEPDISCYAHNGIVYELDGKNKDENGILYTLDKKTNSACVGTPVGGWSGSASYLAKDGDFLELPAYVKSGDVYYTVNAIAPAAFAGAADLSTIVIPSTVKSIPDDAFLGIENSLRILTYKDSAAQSFAEEQGIACEAHTTNVFVSTFVDEDGTILAITFAGKGEDAYFPDIEPDGPNGEEFKGWDKPLENMVADTTFTIVYEKMLTTFKDLKDGQWYSGAVEYALQNGIMGGVGAGRFDPNGATTRGMFVTVLYRLEGEPDVSDVEVPFTDNPDGAWYADAVKWAYANQVVNGMTATLFKPDNKMTREQFMTIMYRYAANVKEYDTLTDGSDALAGFADKDEVSSYALDAVNWACNPKYAFVGGTLKGDKNYVMPRDNTTRAQMATILHRFVKYYE